MTARAVAALQPVAAFADARAAQQSTLAKVAKITTPWLLEDYPNVSATGFLRIARLREVVAKHPPYQSAASEAYEEELGDAVPFDPQAAPEEREAAAIDAGTNLELLSFPAHAYGTVLRVAGFEFDLPPSSAPPSDAGDGSAAFDPQHAALLRSVEHGLRTLVATKLAQVAGTAWIKTRVPGDTKDKWEKRRAADRDSRRDSYPPIYYADLTDLSDIICRKDNWQHPFKPVFKSKEDLQACIRRLSPIRNALAHSRPLVRADQLCLAAEALRLLRAMDLMP